MTNIIIYSIVVGLLSFLLYEGLVYYQSMTEGGGEQCPPPSTEETTPSTNAQDMTQLKAVMIGATGATGKYLFAGLIKDQRFTKITTIGRRAAFIPEDVDGASDINLEEDVKSGRLVQITKEQIDLNKEINKETVGKYLEGHDVYFSAFGTTRKIAGSAEEFRRIDYGINVDMMTVAKEVGVPHCSFMSSQGSNSNSYFLYMQVKGQIEDKAKELAFDKTSIWRPGVMDRGSTTPRFTEKLAKFVLHTIPVQHVASAMLKEAVERFQNKGEHLGTKCVPIYLNRDIYRYDGLGPKGQPLEK